VISGSDDKTLKVWNLETGQEKSTLTGHRDWVCAVAVTPDGKHVISGSGDKTLKVWNLETGQEKSTFTGHRISVSAVAVTSNGKYVISGSGDKTLKVWNLETGQEKSTLTGHSDSVSAVAVTPNGKYVISGSWDNILKVWNLETGKGIFSFIKNLITRRQLFTLTGHSKSVCAVARYNLMAKQPDFCFIGLHTQSLESGNGDREVYSHWS
jgi:WD40 repeat protein